MINKSLTKKMQHFWLSNVYTLNDIKKNIKLLSDSFVLVLE